MEEYIKLDDFFSLAIIIFNYLKICILVGITFYLWYVFNRRKNRTNKQLKIMITIIWLYSLFDCIESITRFEKLKNATDYMREFEKDMILKVDSTNQNLDYKIESMVGRVYDDYNIQQKDTTNIESKHITNDNNRKYINQSK